MKKNIISVAACIAVVIIAVSCSSAGQCPADKEQDKITTEKGADGSARTKDQLVAELITATHSREMIEDSMRQILDQTANVVPDTLKDQVTSIIQEEFSWNHIGPVIENIYRQTYTEEELTGLIKFYSTPLGQKVIKKEPEISTEIYQAMAQISARIQKRLENMIEAEAEQNPPVRTDGQPDSMPESE